MNYPHGIGHATSTNSVPRKLVSGIQFKVSTAHCVMSFTAENGVGNNSNRSEILTEGFLREKVWFVPKHI